MYVFVTTQKLTDYNHIIYLYIRFFFYKASETTLLAFIDKCIEHKKSILVSRNSLQTLKNINERHSKLSVN